MNRFLSTVVTASVLVSGFAFAQDKTPSTTGKQLLRDNQMDGVTAGSAIAVDGAQVTSSDTGTVSLSGTSLSGATGVNIVNSSNGLVANGVNVYDSSLTTQDSNSGAAVNQTNLIKQTQATNAKVNVEATIDVDPVFVDATADASATNIAADNASVTANTNYSVDLAGSAEQNATALNIVNSAGSLVANGVNIAHSANINAIPTLNQLNVTSQSSR